MNLIQTLILGITEGISEFLPISSTGHLVLVSQILKVTQTEFVKSFEIIIQLGAILAVIWLYRKTLLNTKVWPQIIIAFIPAAVIGLFFYKFIKEFLIGNYLITVLALFIGGFIFIVFELWHKKRKLDNETGQIENISKKNAFIIGVFQSISVIPGVSRAGATILGGLFLGLNRTTAAQFSFILAVPTMFAASALDVVKTKLSFTSPELLMLGLGFVISFVVALATIKLFIQYLGKYTFIPFGIYRILISSIYFLIFIR